MDLKMANIETLVEDIHKLLEGRSVFDLPEKLADQFAERMKNLVINRVGRGSEHTPALRISNIGKPCVRQTWLAIHNPEETEPLRAEARMKFLYGDVIEELLLFLAEAAGHTVELVQQQVDVEGVKGHWDAVIDGMVVDAKSASSYSFKKFLEGNLVNDDPFGYVGQIQTYLEAAQDIPEVTIKDRCAFLVMDKTLGHICLDIHKRVEFDVKAITRNKKDIINSLDIPNRAFEPVPEGKSGNMKLGMQCSYCNMKYACWPKLRTFIYSSGPVYLTEVYKEPSVPEVQREEIFKDV